jgi:hypothetical protein
LVDQRLWRCGHGGEDTAAGRGEVAMMLAEAARIPPDAERSYAGYLQVQLSKLRRQWKISNVSVFQQHK